MSGYRTRSQTRKTNPRPAEPVQSTSTSKKSTMPKKSRNILLLDREEQRLQNSIANHIQKVVNDHDNVYIYCRLSKEHDGLSLEVQEAVCKEWCVENDLFVRSTFREIASAFRQKKNLSSCPPKKAHVFDKQKVLNNLLTSVIPPGSLLVVHAVDRFSRNLEKFQYYRNLLEKDDITVIALNGGGPTGTDPLIYDPVLGDNSRINEEFIRAVNKGQNESVSISRRVRSWHKFVRDQGLLPINSAYRNNPNFKMVIKSVNGNLLKGYVYSDHYLQVINRIREIHSLIDPRAKPSSMVLARKVKMLARQERLLNHNNRPFSTADVIKILRSDNLENMFSNMRL